MLRITKEIKAELKAAGQWEVFVERRRELRASGVSTSDAIDQAIEYAKSGKADDKPAKSAELVKSSVFEGKAATRAEEFNWVVANLYIEDVRAEDAPSAVAWTLLQMCRRNNDFAEDLIGRGLVKMLPSKLEDAVHDERFDGEDEYELLAALKSGGPE